MTHIKIAVDQSSWIQMSARFIVGQARKTLNHEGRFVMALSGGGTPRPVYQSLAELWERSGLDWEHVHIMWSDERCVPLDHPKSNYRMAHEVLINEIDIPQENVHPMRCVGDPHSSAAEYALILRELFPGERWPAIDLVLLGLGTDGHTASLFPDSPALVEDKQWVAANEIEGVETARLTLTIPAINASRTIAFLVAGVDKAGVVSRILGPDRLSPKLPAQSIRPTHGELYWLLDAQAASRLPQQ